MISRRLIRIKIVQVLYSHINNEDVSLQATEKEYHLSVKKTYDLYHYFLFLLVKVADYANERIDIARNKILPTREDLNPNTRFVDNPIIHMLRDSRGLTNYITENKLSWADNPEIIKKLLQKITESEYYNKYMSDPKNSFEKDKEFITNIFTVEFEGWELLYQLLEEQSIFWNDDIEFVLGMILKTIEHFKENRLEAKLMPIYKNDEDRDFGIKLLRKSVINYSTYRELIDKYTKNWEVERIAAMDILIMVVAINEIMEFPSIPIKVTLNEYIDIARFYSTAKSNEFVNGILDKIVIDLQNENKIVKTGRGLMSGKEK
ncbi:MAG TPA: transcription antitermination factor NusB [Bacteroidales bacterium]|nr:transcription antitermination factor NusB [Bacteroidales bacterium]